MRNLSSMRFYVAAGLLFAALALSGLALTTSERTHAAPQPGFTLHQAAASWQDGGAQASSLLTSLGATVPITTPAAFHDATPPGLPSLSDSSVAWGDYDNDGLLDLIMIGFGSSSGVTRLYHNDGGGAFHDATPPGLPAAYRGTVAWADYDNDDLLDFFIQGYGSSGFLSKLYHNDGGGAFHDATPPGLRGALDGVVSWADYDNDGLLDFLIGGYNNGNNIYLYHNDGGGAFHDATPSNLPRLASASIAWGDYDNDGLLDLLITGEGGTQGIFSKLYHNDGGGTFHENTSPGLPPLDYGSVDWGDYDNDGLLDFFLKGSGSPGFISRIYHNDGGGAFHNVIQANLLGLTLGDADWGDYDNDGLLDLIITGSNSSNGKRIKLYRNSGGGLFEDVTPLDWPGLQLGCAAWGDYDNDGKLDVFLTGTTPSNTFVALIYHNDALLANTLPGPPADLTVSGVTTNSVVMAWSAATDTQTVASGLTYNLRVGTAPGASDVVGPMANTTMPTQPDGLRRIPALGPARPSLTATLRSLLPNSTYYWSVQAIDHALAGGPFAAEGQFTTSALSTVTPTSTSTPVPTNTPIPTNTPAAANLVGHMTWQSIPQNNPRSILPLTLTLKLGSTEVNYPQQNTDASGFFTVSVGTLAPGTYNWRVMAPDGVSGGNLSSGFLANCGQVMLTGDPQTNVELGTMIGGDADNNNIVSASDFNTLKNEFGQSGLARSDFNNDTVVSSSDFNILKGNFGQSGCAAH